jgi:hypothetical protein
MLRKQLRQSVWFTDQSVAPMLDLMQRMPGRDGLSTQMLQLQFNRRSVEFTHEAANVL